VKFAGFVGVGDAPHFHSRIATVFSGMDCGVEEVCPINLCSCAAVFRHARASPNGDRSNREET
jgi:hypothetical protein